MDTTLDHQRVREIGNHEQRVDEIRRRAQHWRLVDCNEETLIRMRRALIEEMERLEAELAEADERLQQFVHSGRPLDTERSLEMIERLSVEWEKLNRHLQEVDESLLERHLRTRLIQRLGSARALFILDTTVLVFIIIVVSLTAIEWLFPLSPSAVSRIITVDTLICLFLIGDFFLRLGHAEDKKWYFRRYWIDLVSSIPFYEFLRFGRLVRIVRFARLFRLVRLGRVLRVLRFAFRGLDELFQTFQLNLLKRSILIATALLFFGALSIRSLEGAQEQSLRMMSESLWWSFTTVVTGGFADLYSPNTVSGRFVTVGLVLLGLTVTGIFTASLTSVLVEDESVRIEQNQNRLEVELAILNQKIDLLSGETNQGLLALETVAQALSNQRSTKGVAMTLARAMTQYFEAVQASVHLLDGEQQLLRCAAVGLEEVTPPERMPLSHDLAGRVTADLLRLTDVAATDLEPETELSVNYQGIIMVCPLVAGRRVLGVLHVVLPDSLARYYLYNRVPMTLAHHAAMAFYTAGLEESGRWSIDGAGPEG